MDTEPTKDQIKEAFKKCWEESKVPEAVILTHMTLMARQSLCPETYEMFCQVHNRLVDNRSLPLPKL